MKGSISHVIASCAALAAFAVAILAGLAVGNDGLTVLGRAVVAMIACWFVGLICGSMIQAAVRQHVERHAEQEQSEESAAPAGDAEPAAATDRTAA